MTTLPGRQQGPGACCCGSVSFNCPEACPEGCALNIKVTISGLTGGCAPMNSSAGWASDITMTQSLVGGFCGWAGGSAPIDSTPFYAIRWVAFIDCFPNEGWVLTLWNIAEDANPIGYFVWGSWRANLGIGTCPELGVVSGVECDPSLPVGLGCVYGFGPYTPCDNLPTITLTAI